MTPSEVTAARLALQWTKAHLGRVLGRGEKTIRDWENGKTKVPSDVADWLWRAKRFFDANPPLTRRRYGVNEVGRPIDW